MLIKQIYIIFFSLLWSSCIVAEIGRPEKIFYVMLEDNDSYTIDIMFGTSETIHIKEYELYKLKQNSLRGGETYLFGYIKINEQDPNYAKHILIKKQNGNIIKEYSYNEITKMNFIKLDSINAYIIKDLN